ncbi:hypothetical protein G647_00121 [Cladophialophora carrionii CBS 160.54]|uniref:Uncharacterized protein n=1 Tax=Cladophialophora carrionii CBS 160.54 TaxID=1279043 RepID=V9DNY3_9EURO|nr:uncharacterized protein G647_00121 [Cladophialophora carrionii CBS 160.54]ETI27672.1 hypothetical protein G647_00121 [Cladophialophora carrionii CBS 160.54]
MPSPQQIPPSGVHQGTISFPIAVLPQLQAWVDGEWQRLADERKVPHLNQTQYQELRDLIERATRLFGFTHEVRQRRTKKPAQSAQMIPTPGPENANTAPPSNGTSGYVPNAENYAHGAGEDDLAGIFVGSVFDPQNPLLHLDDFATF